MVHLGIINQYLLLLSFDTSYSLKITTTTYEDDGDDNIHHSVTDQSGFVYTDLRLYLNASMRSADDTNSLVSLSM